MQNAPREISDRMTIDRRDSMAVGRWYLPFILVFGSLILTATLVILLAETQTQGSDFPDQTECSPANVETKKGTDEPSADGLPLPLDRTEASQWALQLLDPLNLETPQNTSGWVRGRVESSRGIPIADAEIELRPGSSRRSAGDHAFTTKSDAEGKFELEVPLEVSGVLSASAKDYVPAVEFGVAAEMDVLCVLEEGVSLRGKVIDAKTGIPIAGAVAFVARGMNASATSDTLGHFLLGPFEGTVNLDVVALGYDIAHYRNLALGVCGDHADPAEFALRRGAFLFVRVVDSQSGAPVENAEVAYSLSVPSRGLFASDQNGGISQSVTTDCTGQATFACVGIGGAILEVKADGYLTLTQKLDSAPSRGDPLVLGLSHSWVAEGLVLDHEGRAVLGASVFPRSSLRRFGPQTSTDSNGHFRLDGLDPNRPITLIAQHPNFVPTESAPVSPKSEDIKIRFCTAGMISGVVLEPDETPVANLRVRLDVHGSATGLTTDWPRVTITDREGRFRFFSLPNARYTVSSRTTVYVGHAEILSLGEGEHREMTLSLLPGYSISGHVLDSSGNPLEGCRLSGTEFVESHPSGRKISGLESPMEFRAGVLRQRAIGGTRLQGRTDAEGGFILGGLTEGATLRLTVSRRGYAEASVSILAGTQGEVIFLEGYRVLQGRVFDASTRCPIESFWLEFRESTPRNEPRDRSRRSGQSSRRESFNSPDGEFLIDRMVTREYRVRCHADGFESSNWRDVVIPTDAELRPLSIYLSPGSLVSGRVVSAEDRPVERIPVFLLRKPEPESSYSQIAPRIVSTDSEGIYRFRNIPSSTYQLGVGSPDLSVIPMVDVEVQEGLRLQRDFRLPRLASVEVVVRDSNGKVVKGVNVRAVFQSISRTQRTARTDARGSAVFRDLLSGTYMLSATSREQTSGDLSVFVSLDSRTQHDLTLSSRR